VASHYINNRSGFEETAREWTKKHATGTSDPEFGLDKQSIERLLQMGFERSQVVDALRRSAGKEQDALEALLS
jgi:hypothetical protein